MDQAKKDRLNQIRRQLANPTPDLKAELESRGMIATVEGRTLSLKNSHMVYMQRNGGAIPTVVGGFKQWKAAGRQVQKGQHGYSILFPIGNKDDNGELISADRFYCGTVFDITQTAPIGEQPTAQASPDEQTEQRKPEPVQTHTQPENDTDNIMKDWRIV